MEVYHLHKSCQLKHASDCLKSILVRLEIGIEKCKVLLVSNILVSRVKNIENNFIYQFFEVRPLKMLAGQVKMYTTGLTGPLE